MGITVEYQYANQSGGPTHPDHGPVGGQFHIKYFQIIIVSAILGTWDRILHDLYVQTLCVS